MSVDAAWSGAILASLPIIGGGLVTVGVALLVSAARVLRSARRRGVLAVRGPYGFVRHTQYLGLAIAGMGTTLLQWPSLAAALVLGILAVGGLALALREETRMEEEFGCCWQAYAYGRPAFVPRLSRVARALVDLVRVAGERVSGKASGAGAGAPLIQGREDS